MARCPACKSSDYGPVDLAYPFDLPENNPNPSISLVVEVCLDCGHVTDES